MRLHAGVYTLKRGRGEGRELRATGQGAGGTAGLAAAQAQRGGRQGGFQPESILIRLHDPNYL